MVITLAYISSNVPCGGGHWVSFRMLSTVPVLVAGDPIRDERHGLAVTVLVPETTCQHDHLSLQLSVHETEGEREGV